MKIIDGDLPSLHGASSHLEALTVRAEQFIGDVDMHDSTIFPYDVRELATVLGIHQLPDRQLYHDKTRFTRTFRDKMSSSYYEVNG